MDARIIPLEEEKQEKSFFEDLFDFRSTSVFFFWVGGCKRRFFKLGN